MQTYLDAAPFCPLKVTAGNLTTSFVAGISDIAMSNRQQFDGESRSVAPNVAWANELALIVYKVQGSANEIWLQVQESDTDAFTIPVVVPIAGQEYYKITSTISDSTYVRLPLVNIRAKNARILAKYSGGAATGAALTVLAMRLNNDSAGAQAVSVIGTSGKVADVRPIDYVADEGQAFNAAIAVSAGAWLSNVVTFTTTAHAWIAGDVITVSGCGNASYNGTYTVVSAATDTWTAALTPDPGAFTTAGSAIQAQSTTRLVDQNKAWTASEWSARGAYVEITSGTGARQYKAITSNGTHWLAFGAMTTAPVTSDSAYQIVELNVNALVTDTELTVKLGSITVSNVDLLKYIASPPDLAGGETCQGRADIKGNVQVVGPEAHGAAAVRAPVLGAGYASAAIQTAVDAADVCRLWTTLNGAQVVAARNQDATADVSTALEVGTDNAASVTTPTPLRVGGICRTSGADYTTLDTCTLSFDLKGGVRVAGATPSGEAAIGNPLLSGGKASTALPSAVDANDSIALWLSLNGATVIAGRCEDGGTDVATAFPIGTDNAAGSDTTPDLLKIGGQARAGGAAYTEADSVVASFDLVGGLRVAGSVAHGVAATGNPLLCGAYASDVIQAATTAGYASRLWASLSGALCIAGLYQHATPATAIAKTIPVVVDDAIMFTGATALPVAGQYNATALTYTDKDATVLQTTVNGTLKTTSGISSGSILHGQKTIAVPGTEEAIAGANTLTNGQSILIRAMTTNAANVYVGGNPVTSATGHILAPGEECTLAVNNTNLVFIDVDTALDGISWIVEGG